MLQRAASNAYSWWWASHIRTKQSKWLEQSLQDMEEKVVNAMNLVQKDGDSFAKRAEMYYKHRPELIAFIEESVRAYRALAERYDKLSTDLQKANTTIASVFPDQLPYDTDYEDDDDNDNNRHNMLKNIGPGPDPPKAPKVPETIKTFLTNGPKKSPVKKITKADNHSNGFMKSGLTKDEAVEEIDKLQKDILSMQTVKEFTKSSYESGLAKFSEIENKIIEMQQRVCDLEDEFKVVKGIEDDDARAIMAEAALKSCEESLAKLQAKHEKSSQEARLERERVQNVEQKFESFKHEYLQFRDHDDDDENDEHKHEKHSRNTNESEENELQAKIKETLKGLSNKPLTVTEMADMIDKLVNTVISLETLVSSQSALIDRLRTETDDLHTQIQNLEEDKANSIGVGPNLAKTFKDMEKKLDGVQELEMNIENQNKSLKMHFTEAHCNVHHLFENICNMNEDFKLSEPSINGGEIKLTTERVEEKEIKYTNDDPKKQDEEATDETNWQELLLGGLDNKEKVLLQEYTTILRKYKTAKKELVDEEQKNQETVCEMKTQLLDLKTLLEKRDNEIQQMKQKLKLLQEVHKEVTNEEVDIKSIFMDKREPVSEIEAKLRTDIDAILDENLDFWLRFSSTFHQVQKFKTEVEDLQQEIVKVKAKQSDGKSSIRSEINAIFKHLKEIQTELTIWIDQSTLLKNELQRRFSSLFDIQEDIKRALREGIEEDEIKFNTHQAAKFQGEVSNMQQENTKVNQELEAGLNHVTTLQVETEKTLKRLEDEFSLFDQKQPRSPNRPHVPLRSFIFGVKSKKQKPSILACINPHKRLTTSNNRIM
ncbi:hypothetical protein L1987_71219 [Smallanthus sonchifolius]|uniref:Uncharacterized protein n=1 Tax=Smallanthus sonchifolius TaxID=185202 RepID=A0ACB9AR18_9ASTR|nr:hypothetical protein L1987_71219 [Smallanthus sonchifolius]